MAAFLAFRLEITNRKPPKLQLTVHLPDPMYPFLRRDHTELEIAVSIIVFNEEYLAHPA